jgi:hypothetical protein
MRSIRLGWLPCEGRSCVGDEDEIRHDTTQTNDDPRGTGLRDHNDGIDIPGMVIRPQPVLTNQLPALHASLPCSWDSPEIATALLDLFSLLAVTSTSQALWQINGLEH